MKWWYVFVIILGVFVGGWIWGKYGEKAATKIGVIEGSKIEKEMLNNPTMIISNKDGVKKEVIQVLGRVRTWNYESGILEFSQDEKIWRVKIDLDNTTMYVNSLKVTGNSVSVNSIEDPNWRTGFCPDDEVVLRLDGDEVVFVINNGYRYCGFKDK